MSICGRCGENEATLEFGGLIGHGGGTPYCERCATEEQAIHARERADALPELELRLAELGGPAPRVICGYASWHFVDQSWPPGTLCELDRGHEGHHAAAVVGREETPDA